MGELSKAAAGHCREIAADRYARRICAYTARHYARKKEDLDKGFARIVHPEGQSPHLEVGRSNGKADAVEVYADAIEFAEREDDANRERFRALVAQGTADAFRIVAPLRRFLGARGDTRLPWLIDDSALFARVAKDVDDLQRAVGGTGPAQRKRLALALFDHIRKPKAEGGLGIALDEVQQDPQKDAAGVIKAGKATCIEFVFLYLALARQAGLDARPVRVYTKPDGTPWDHTQIGVELGEGKVLFLCLESGVGLAPTQQWAFMPKTGLIAYDRIGRALLNASSEDPKVVREHKRRELERALDFDPGNYMAHYNLGHLEEERKNYEASAQHYLWSREAYPQYPDTHHNLALVCARLRDSKPRSPVLAKCPRTAGVAERHSEHRRLSGRSAATEVCDTRTIDGQ